MSPAYDGYREPMLKVTYDRQLTTARVIDSSNDFIFEDGKYGSQRVLLKGTIALRNHCATLIPSFACFASGVHGH